MLRGNLRRCCHRCHRFDALAFNRHQQPQAVIMHRLLAIDMAKHGAERLDIGRKSRFTPLSRRPFRSPDPDERYAELPHLAVANLDKYTMSDLVLSKIRIKAQNY